MEDVEEDERFFGLIADHHPKYEDIRKWTVVSDNGVGYRSSTKFYDRAAGKGPAREKVIESPSEPLMGETTKDGQVPLHLTSLFLPLASIERVFWCGRLCGTSRRSPVEHRIRW